MGEHHIMLLNIGNGLFTGKLLTADGRTPPSAVYSASFPTGIPMPYTYFT